MLVLGRRQSQWVEVTHHSGDVMLILVNRIFPATPDKSAKVDLGFQDDARNFTIDRPERAVRSREARARAVPLLARLHGLVASGRDGSEEAERLRDEVEPLWLAMGPEERREVGGWARSMEAVGIAAGS